MAMRPYTSSKVVSSRLIVSPARRPVALWIILPLNWLSTPNRTEKVRRFRKSLGSTGAAAATAGCTLTGHRFWSRSRRPDHLADPRRSLGRWC